MEEHAYRGAALSVRDRFLESLNDTNAHFEEKDSKRCYDLSAEYRIGRYVQKRPGQPGHRGEPPRGAHDLGFRLENRQTGTTASATPTASSSRRSSMGARWRCRTTGSRS